MRGDKTRYIAEPGENDITTHTRCLYGHQRMIGRIRPVAEIGHEAVALRVAMDIDDQPCKIAVVGHREPAERALEQRARSLVHPIESPRIGVEQVREAATRIGSRIKGVADAHQEVK